ncbi:hypothetical protein D9M70_539230 [compost metagenome]
MKGFAGIMLIAAIATAEAEPLAQLSPATKEDLKKWALTDGDVTVTNPAIPTTLPATYEVKHGLVIQDTICKDSTLSWEQCSAIVLISFANDCIELELPMFCQAYKALHNTIGTRYAHNRRKP